jgi:hypothetical protein
MKKHDFIIGAFLECDIFQELQNDLDNFCECHGGICLFATEKVRIVAFPDDNDEEKLEAEWRTWTENYDCPASFEWIKAPIEWSKRWSQSFPVRLEEAVRRNGIK